MNDPAAQTPSPPPASTGFHAVRNQARGSALAKYRDMVVGSSSWWPLVRYEFLMTLFSQVPGLLGIVCRRALYPGLFARMERGVVIGTAVALRQPAKISLGPGCLIDDLASLSARGDDATRITLGREVFIGRGAVLSVRHGQIELGDHANIGAACRIGCSGGTLRLGQHVLVGAFTYIGGGMHRHDRTDVPMALQGQVFKGGVTIEDDVWIGGGCQILDGVTIGTGSIIGAGAIVTRSIPPRSIAFGNPARVHKTRTPADPAHPPPADSAGMESGTEDLG